MKRNRKLNEHGFSMVEALVIVVFLATIAGTGYFVMHKKDNTPKQTASTSNSQLASSGSSSPHGISESIQQITEQEANSEEAIDNASDSSVVSQATSANAAASNVGGAYNASTL